MDSVLQYSFTCMGPKVTTDISLSILNFPLFSRIIRVSPHAKSTYHSWLRILYHVLIICNTRNLMNLLSFNKIKTNIQALQDFSNRLYTYSWFNYYYLVRNGLCIASVIENVQHQHGTKQPSQAKAHLLPSYRIDGMTPFRSDQRLCN